MSTLPLTSPELASFIWRYVTVNFDEPKRFVQISALPFKRQVFFQQSETRARHTLRDAVSPTTDRIHADVKCLPCKQTQVSSLQRHSTHAAVHVIQFILQRCSNIKNSDISLNWYKMPTPSFPAMLLGLSKERRTQVALTLTNACGTRNETKTLQNTLLQNWSALRRRVNH